MNNTSTTSRLVLVTPHIEERWLARLQALSPELLIERRPDARVEAIPDDLWQNVEVLYTLATLPSPEQAPHLRWVQLYSAGANQALESPLMQNAVTFTTASSVHAVNIAEYVFTTMLAWFHRFPQMLMWKQQGQWPSQSERNSLFVPTELRGLTIGIVGYGSIGREVARLARAFGMSVLAMARGVSHHDRGFLFPGIGDVEGNLPDHYYKPDQLYEMLGESDVVIITVPLTSQTQGMFDKAAFQSMKKTAFLVNIARGDVCDEADLIHALQEEQIAGAALDVFHEEPLPSDSPLLRLPNVFLSPHVAGLTPRYDERAAMIFEENMRRYLHNEPLYNVLNKEQGY